MTIKIDRPEQEDLERIWIDRGLYRHLLSKAVRIEEPASSILRRELGLPPSGQRNGAATAPSPTDSTPGRTALDGFVHTLEFQNRRNATEKFLALLALMHQEHPSEFERVLQVSGRTRNYFGRSMSEITRSGHSTHPQEIPGSSFWVMTNADTAHKQEIFRRAASVLGYSSAEVETAARAIR
jgi:negative modulator of initiation of replication